MTTLGGPPGVGGPKGPGGPQRASEPSEASPSSGADEVAGDAAVDRAPLTGTTELDALAAELAAGRVTPRDAIDRLMEATAGPELAALDDVDRAELRELLGDLVANDPHLGNLISRI